MHVAEIVAAIGTVLLVVGLMLVARALTHVSEANERLVASFAGGVSLAFVLLDLFVELVEGTAHELHVRAGPESVHTIAVLILAGAALAFAANVLGMKRRAHSHAIALVPQILYRALIGAALEEELHEGKRAFALFWLAMVLHLGIAEHTLDRRYPERHRGVWRVLGAVSPILGAGIAAAAKPSLATTHEILAVVAGATILSIFEEEIPSPAEVKLGAFFGGLLAFGALVQARWWM
jgi:hypothetical protein